MFYKLLLFFFLFFLYSNNSFGQTTIYSQMSNGLTDWNDSSIWDEDRGGGTNPILASGNNLIIQNGDTITINSDLTVNSVVVESGGKLRFDDTSRNLVIIDSIYIENNAEFRVSTTTGVSYYHILTIGGNIFNDGLFNMSPVSNRTSKVIFNKDGNQTISGPDSIIFGVIELDMGNSNANVLEILSPIGVNKDTLTLKNGTFKLSSAAQFMPFSTTAAAKIPSTSGFILNSPDAYIEKGGSAGLEVNGLLEINSGTFEVGSLTGNELLISGSDAVLNINGGVLDLSGRLRLSSSSTINITGGEINILKAGASGNNQESFRVPGGTKINMSGGQIKIFNGNNSNNDVSVSTIPANINVIGGTVIIGDGTNTSGDIQIQWRENLHNLIIDAGNTLTSLFDSLYVTGNLELISGLFSLEDYNLILSDTSSILGTPSNSNMIVTPGTGKLFKEINSNISFTFPIGDNNNTPEYSPAVLEFLNGDYIDASVGVNVTNTKHDSVYLVADEYLQRYWSISSNGISNFNCIVSFNYNDSDIVGNEINLYLGQWKDTSWTVLDKADFTNNILIDTVSTFSDFTGAEEDGLPVELINFTASVINQSVNLIWSTAAEINNYGFYIERKNVLDKKDKNSAWKELSFINGAGNSNSIKKYTFFDKGLLPGEYNYRLKQVDFNGAYEYSNEINISVEPIKEFLLHQNFPNPFNPVTTIGFNIPQDAFVTIDIYNILGERILSLINDQKSAGFYSVEFDASQLESGIYFYQIKADSYSQTKKMLIIK